MSFPYSRMNGGDDTFDILQIRGADQLSESPPLPAELVSLDLPDEVEASNTHAGRTAGRGDDPGRRGGASRDQLGQPG
jgi:hypothetical protein